MFFNRITYTISPVPSVKLFSFTPKATASTIELSLYIIAAWLVSDFVRTAIHLDKKSVSGALKIKISPV